MSRASLALLLTVLSVITRATKPNDFTSHVVAVRQRPGDLSSFDVARRDDDNNMNLKYAIHNKAETDIAFNPMQLCELVQLSPNATVIEQHLCTFVMSHVNTHDDIETDNDLNTLDSATTANDSLAQRDSSWDASSSIQHGHALPQTRRDTASSVTVSAVQPPSTAAADRPPPTVRLWAAALNAEVAGANVGPCMLIIMSLVTAAAIVAHSTTGAAKRRAHPVEPLRSVGSTSKLPPSEVPAGTRIQIYYKGRTFAHGWYMAEVVSSFVIYRSHVRLTTLRYDVPDDRGQREWQHDLAKEKYHIITSPQATGLAGIAMSDNSLPPEPTIGLAVGATAEAEQPAGSDTASDTSSPRRRRRGSRGGRGHRAPRKGSTRWVRAQAREAPPPPPPPPVDNFDGLLPPPRPPSPPKPKRAPPAAPAFAWALRPPPHDPETCDDPTCLDMECMEITLPAAAPPPPQPEAATTAPATPMRTRSRALGPSSPLYDELELRYNLRKRG